MEWVAEVHKCRNNYVLTGASLLARGVAASRLEFSRTEDFTSRQRLLVVSAGEDSAAVIVPIVNASSLKHDLRPAARVTLFVKASHGQLKVPERAAQQALGVGASDLDDDDEVRWLRQAVLFILEARDPDVRDQRIKALNRVLD